MKIFYILILFISVITAGCQKDYIIGGTKSETNKVDMATYDFLKSFGITKKQPGY